MLLHLASSRALLELLPASVLFSQSDGYPEVADLWKQTEQFSFTYTGKVTMSRKAIAQLIGKVHLLIPSCLTDQLLALGCFEATHFAVKSLCCALHEH